MRLGDGTRGDIRQIRRALADPARIAAVLGLLDGARRQAVGLMVRCPAHDDAVPSCSLRTGNDGTLYFHCFGCSAGGDVLTLIATIYGLDARTQFPAIVSAAVKTIDQIDQIGRDDHLLLSNGFSASSNTQSSVCDSRDFDRVAQIILTACPLTSSPDALEYLSDRRVLDLAQRDGWAVLPETPTGQGDIIEAIVDEVGDIVWQGSGLCCSPRSFVWPQHRLVIPWVAAHGTVDTLQRRGLRELGGNTPRYVFPRGRKPVMPYGSEKLHAAVPVIAFVEGAIDVLSMRKLCALHSAVRDVVGLPGLTWRREWAHLAAKRIALVCLDADGPGDRTVQSIASDLRAAGATAVHRAKPVEGKDWNDVLMGVA